MPKVLVLLLATAGLGCTMPVPIPRDGAALDGGRRDAPGLDAPGLDAPALDAPGADAPIAPPDVPGTRPNGDDCNLDAQCTSGHCVDDVCCASTCAGDCLACAASLTGAADGVCAPVDAGDDPHDDCNPQPATTCGTTGECDGAGACARHDDTTVCVAGTCSGTVETPPRTCDGAGVCEPPVSRPCAPYRCGGSTCLRSCTTTSDCLSPNVCAMGMCVPALANGTPCTSAAQCASSFCVDGVCCADACTGLCRACDGAFTVPGTAGRCEPIDCGDPDDECGTPFAPVCRSLGGGSCGPSTTC